MLPGGSFRNATRRTRCGTTLHSPEWSETHYLGTAEKKMLIRHFIWSIKVIINFKCIEQTTVIQIETHRLIPSSSFPEDIKVCQILMD